MIKKKLSIRIYDNIQVYLKIKKKKQILNNSIIKERKGVSP